VPPPLPPPRDLTIPLDGSTTARDVVSRGLGRLMGELGAIGRHAPRDAASRADVAALLGVVRELASTNPGALASVVRRPTVGALLRCLRAEADERRRAALVAEVVATVLVDLAMTGALGRDVRLEGRLAPRVLSLPGRLALALPSDARALVVGPERLEVERSSGRASLDLAAARDASVDDLAARAPALAPTRPFAPIDRGVVLALADNNPLAHLEAHPDKQGNAIDLGGRPVEAWTSALRDALALVETHLPALRAVIDVVLHQVVPVGWDAEKHLSASYQEAVGTIYLSLHPSPMTMVEAVIHEAQHNVLNTLLDLDPVLENPRDALYASPVRPDPRPIHGVLLAVHAFLPVARLYQRMIEAGAPEAASPAFLARHARVREVNREGAALVLAHARPTPVGAALIEEIRRWDAHDAAP
jgi:HEXXH motif-containing protein